MVRFVIAAVIVAASIWVFVDARRLGAKRGVLGGGLLDAGAIEWLVGCLFVWIVVLPCYFVARRKLAAAKVAREAWSSAPHADEAETSDPMWATGYSGAATPWTGGGSQLVSYRHMYVTSTGGSRARTALVVGVIIAFMAAIVGWRTYVMTSGSPSRPGAQPLAISTPSSAAVEPSGIAAKLAKIALRASDFRPGYTMILAPYGDQLVGHATLDNCAFHFTSETHRVARREYHLTDAAGLYRGATNEVVAYDNSHDAALALHQWYRAAAHCPHDVLPFAVEGVHGLKEHVTRNVLHRNSLPNKRNVVTREWATAPGAPKLFSVCILQVRGRILDALAVSMTTRPSRTETTADFHLAAVTGRRLHRHA